MNIHDRLDIMALGLINGMTWGLSVSPPSSIALLVADAVVDELNAASFGVSFTAARRYVDDRKLETLSTSTPVVSVFPVVAPIEAIARKVWQQEITVDIAVVQRLSDKANSTVDDLYDLVNAIGEYFCNRRLSNYSGAIWMRTEYPTGYDEEKFLTMNLFYSLVRLVFRVHGETS